MSFVAAICMAQGGSTQSPPPQADRAQSFSDAELQAILARVPLGVPGKSGSLSKRLVTVNTFSMSLIRLSEPDQPKAHGAWGEVFVVREGSGIVQTGGTITGTLSNDSAAHRSMFLDPVPATRQTPAEAKAAAAQREAQGDKSGTDQEGGTLRRVAAGDMVLIPAGVAHRWKQVDKQVVYLAIKFPRSE